MDNEKEQGDAIDLITIGKKAILLLETQNDLLNDLEHELIWIRGEIEAIRRKMLK